MNAVRLPLPASVHGRKTASRWHPHEAGSDIKRLAIDVNPAHQHQAGACVLWVGAVMLKTFDDRGQTPYTDTQRLGWSRLHRTSGNACSDTKHFRVVFYFRQAVSAPLAR